LRPEPRQRAYQVIFEHDTPAGRAFDVGLIAMIVLSVIVVMLESVGSIRLEHGPLLRALEWGFTLLFSIEYGFRIWCSPRRIRYVRSFFGIVDLIAILPTYLSLVLPGGQALLSVRALRLLRVFRVLKLVHHVQESRILLRALRQSRDKITVFIAVVLTLVVILGSLMYLVEGSENGFTSIPRSVYWAIVTLTTVGYGDIAPQTNLGQALAAMIMIMGYAIIAVPTGIVTVELGNVQRREIGEKSCSSCGLVGHDGDASYCRRCGGRLGSPEDSRETMTTPGSIVDR
jgi:voltage-gated potassium channel